MKTTTNKKILEKVERFSELKKKTKDLVDEQLEIREELESILISLDTRILVVGDYAVVITDRVRKDLDKEKVHELLGETFLECFRKVEYQTLEVKKA